MADTYRDTTAGEALPLSFAQLEEGDLAPEHVWWQRFNLSFWTGVALLVFVVLAAVVGPILSPHDPLEQDLLANLQGPSLEHPLGTDLFGRDLLTRILYAIRIDLVIALSATAYTMVLGVTIGAITGYYGGWLDTILMRLVDILIAFPTLILLIAVIAILGQGAENMFIAIGIVGWIPYARLVRGEVLVNKELEYIQAAVLLGASGRRIILRHLMPNVITPAVVFSTIAVIGNILLVAALSFLGLGVQPPTPELGTMINEGRQFILTHWNLIIFPGLAIGVLGIAFSLLGDGLTDYLRPQG
jgi:peptide/nickel transport system permease protein